MGLAVAIQMDPIHTINIDAEVMSGIQWTTVYP